MFPFTFRPEVIYFLEIFSVRQVFFQQLFKDGRPVLKQFLLDIEKNGKYINFWKKRINQICLVISECF